MANKQEVKKHIWSLFDEGLESENGQRCQRDKSCDRMTAMKLAFIGGVRHGLREAAAITDSIHSKAILYLQEASRQKEIEIQDE